MLTPSIWSRPPASLQLGVGEVHVWRAYLPAYFPRLAALADLLSADEHMRAARFHFAHDRERYILARGLLREIVHWYLAVAPEHLRFSYGLHGKPALATPADGGWVHFNLSHAYDLTLYAFCRGQELGVDIERIRTDIEYEQIARHVFSPSEIATLFALPPLERTEAFFRGWTIKEAYIKGLGAGLSLPLDQFDSALTPGTPAAILATRPDASEASRWTVARLDPGPEYAAALAVCGPISKLSCWRVEPEPIL
jgi:4'-phosphopantetheinyl transferase